MRKKLREIMDKEEGFTLVELLAVIAILAIIVAIAVPSIGKVISKSQTDADTADIELIKDAGRIYFTTDETGKAAAKNATASSPGKVSVKTLSDDGYLDLNTKKLEKHKSVELEINEAGKVSYPGS